MVRIARFFGHRFGENRGFPLRAHQNLCVIPAIFKISHQNVFAHSRQFFAFDPSLHRENRGNQRQLRVLPRHHLDSRGSAEASRQFHFVPRFAHAEPTRPRGDRNRPTARRRPQNRGSGNRGNDGNHVAGLAKLQVRNGRFPHIHRDTERIPAVRRPVDETPPASILPVTQFRNTIPTEFDSFTSYSPGRIPWNSKLCFGSIGTLPIDWVPITNSTAEFGPNSVSMVT